MGNADIEVYNKLNNSIRSLSVPINASHHEYT